MIRCYKFCNFRSDRIHWLDVECLSKTKTKKSSFNLENFKGAHSAKGIKSLAKLIFKHENVLSHRNSVKW